MPETAIKWGVAGSGCIHLPEKAATLVRNNRYTYPKKYISCPGLFHYAEIQKQC